MTSPHTTSAYSDLVSDVDIHFQALLEVFPKDSIDDVYYNEPWTSGDPKRMTFQTLALPSYGRRRTELERPKKLSVSMGTQLVKDFWAYSAAVDVTLEMLTFDRQKIAAQMASQLLKACKKTEQLEKTHNILSYADLLNYQPMDVNYTVSFGTPDGKAPGASDHVAGTATGLSNILASENPLRPENLATLIAQCQRTAKNDSAELIDVNFDTLMISDDFEVVKRAVEILKTPNVPFTFENTVNFFNGGNFNGQQMKLMILKKAAHARDGNYADGTSNNDGTGVTVAARRFYWGILDSALNGKSSDTGANRYATTGAGEIFKGPPMENGLYSIWANVFAVWAITRWQGKGYSFAETL